jgi:hypothetical protein
LHPQGHAVEIQVAQHDQVMRASRPRFFDFVRRKGMPPSDVFAAMAARWGATAPRRVLGAGTPYGGGGSIHVVEIPLTAPELSSYLQARSQPTVAAPTRASALQSSTTP